jgi:hypothetical protein
MQNEFKKRLKPSPLFVDRQKITSNNNESEVNFHYLNENDAIENMGLCIGSEFEHAMRGSVATIKKLREPLLLNGCYGNQVGYNQFVSPNAKATFPLPGSERTQELNRAALLSIYISLVQANMSTALFRAPDLDKTIGKNTTYALGPEVIFAPMSKKSLPVFKMELARVLHYAKVFECEALEDTSIHFHIGTGLFGSNKEEFKETFQNFVWFCWENKEFIKDWSGRMGSGEDLADMLYFIGDPYGKMSLEEQKISFMMMKGLNLELFEDKGVIDRKISTDSSNSSSTDSRIKGLFNITIGDKFDTVEIRHDGTDPEFCVEEYMGKYEYYFALVNMCKIAGIHGGKECRSLESLVNYVVVRREEYPHLWNKMLKDKYCLPFIEVMEEYKEGKIPTDQYNIDDLIYFNYNIPEIEKHFSAQETEEKEEVPVDEDKNQKILGLIQSIQANNIGASEPEIIAVNEEISTVIVCSYSGFESTDISDFYQVYNNQKVNWDEVTSKDLSFICAEYYDNARYSEEELEELTVFSGNCKCCKAEIEADEDGDLDCLYWNGQKLCESCFDIKQKEEEEEEDLPFASAVSYLSF